MSCIFQPIVFWNHSVIQNILEGVIENDENLWKNCQCLWEFCWIKYSRLLVFISSTGQFVWASNDDITRFLSIFLIYHALFFCSIYDLTWNTMNTRQSIEVFLVNHKFSFSWFIIFENERNKKTNLFFEAYRSNL
jgi:hypothetical protein